MRPSNRPLFLASVYMARSPFAGSWKHRTSSSNRSMLSWWWGFRRLWTCSWPAQFAVATVTIWLLLLHRATHHDNNSTSIAKQQTNDGGLTTGTRLRGGSSTPRDAMMPPRSRSNDKLGQRVDSSNKYRDHQQSTKGLRATAHERNNDCQVVVDEQGMVVTLPGQLLSTDRPASGVVSDAEYTYYVVCISQHRHHHRVDLDLHLEQGEADLYVSASDPHPRVERGSSWIAVSHGDEHLSLPTYAEDFLGNKPSALFVGVHGRPRGTFSLSVKITDVSDKEMKARAPLAES